MMVSPIGLNSRTRTSVQNTRPVSQLCTLTSYSEMPRKRNMIISATLLYGMTRGEGDEEGGGEGGGGGMRVGGRRRKRKEEEEEEEEEGREEEGEEGGRKARWREEGRRKIELGKMNVFLYNIHVNTVWYKHTL